MSPTVKQKPRSRQSTRKTTRSLERRIFHKVAKCRWCGGRFHKIHRWQWRCEADACFARQVAAAIENPEARKGESPYLFLPLPVQVDLDDVTLPKVLLAGAAGVSKSYGLRWLAYRRCLVRPGYRVLLLRCTYDELEKNHLQYMTREADLLSVIQPVRYNSSPQQRRMYFDHGEDEQSIIFAGYCDNRADIGRHVGPEWDLVIGEEAVKFLPEAIDEISTRSRGSETARLYGSEGGQTWLGSNPGGRAMLYLAEHYITKDPDPEDYPNYKPAQHGHIHATLEDNPYLHENYEEENLSHLKADRYAQLRHGDWSTFGSSFFPAWAPMLNGQPHHVADCNHLL